MPCYEIRTYANQKIVTTGNSAIDYKMLERGLSEVGLKLETTSQTGVKAIVESIGGRGIAYVKEGELTFEKTQSLDVERDTQKIRQAYSLGVALVEAGKNYWSPTVEKVGDNYVIKTIINY